jgi:hypothetical protein
MRFGPALLAAAVTAAAAVVVSGCGGSGSASGVASLAAGTTPQAGTGQTTTTAPTQQDFQAAVLSFTRCMRANGVQMADPTFGGGGSGGGGLFRLRADRNNPKFRKAQEACRSKLEAVRPQFTPGQQKEFQATALKFAQCMRKNGVDVPDPDFSQGGGGGGRGLFGGSGINRNDPKVQAAFQTCQKVFTGSGPGGFRFGGPPGGGPPPGGGGS